MLQHVAAAMADAYVPLPLFERDRWVLKVQAFSFQLVFHFFCLLFLTKQQVNLPRSMEVLSMPPPEVCLALTPSTSLPASIPCQDVTLCVDVYSPCYGHSYKDARLRCKSLRSRLHTTRPQSSAPKSNAIGCLVAEVSCRSLKAFAIFLFLYFSPLFFLFISVLYSVYFSFSILYSFSFFILFFFSFSCALTFFWFKLKRLLPTLWQDNHLELQCIRHVKPWPEGLGFHNEHFLLAATSFLKRIWA